MSGGPTTDARQHSISPPWPVVAGQWSTAVLAALAIALLPLPQLLAAVGLTLAVTLPLLNPVFGVYLAVLSVPVQDLVTLPGGLSCTQAAVLLALAGWGLHLVRARTWQTWGAAGTAHTAPRVPPARLLALWLALLWALLLSASLTPYSRAEGLKETARWGGAFLIWLIGASTVRRPWQIYGLAACLIAAPTAEAIVGLVQFATGDGPPTFRIAPDSSFVRAYGTIGQPNSFAGYMNMAWPVAAALAIASVRLRGVGPAAQLALSAALWCAAALLLAALIASFSRGAWLGAALGALGMAAVLGRRAALAAGLTLGAGVLALALGGAGLLPESVATRIASISRSVGLFDAEGVTVTPENFAVVERMAHIQAGWRMLQERPVVGVGPGNYSIAYPEFAVGTWYISRGHAHNYYLHIAAEAGLAGLAAYLALIAAIAARAVIAVRATSATVARSVTVGCCGMIVAVAGHNLFENLHVLNMGIQLAAGWVLAEAVVRLPATGGTAAQLGASPANVHQGK
ncbi:MAG: hypothetical protein RLZZ387_2660 [Chloroflexota bacterium]